MAQGSAIQQRPFPCGPSPPPSTSDHRSFLWIVVWKSTNQSCLILSQAWLWCVQNERSVKKKGWNPETREVLILVAFCILFLFIWKEDLSAKERKKPNETMVVMNVHRRSSINKLSRSIQKHSSLEKTLWEHEPVCCSSCSGRKGKIYLCA